MTKFYGPVGYIHSVENPTGSGIWVEEATERNHRGNVLLDNISQQQTENLNNDLRLNNRISIIGDPYALTHVHAIRYVKYAGGYWTVRTVEVNTPRIILNLGGVYNGKKA